MGGIADIATMRLNSPAQQFGGFAPGRRVFGGAKNADCGGGNPHFEDFAKPKEAQTTKQTIWWG